MLSYCLCTIHTTSIFKLYKYFQTNKSIYTQVIVYTNVVV